MSSPWVPRRRSGCCFFGTGFGRTGMSGLCTKRRSGGSPPGAGRGFQDYADAKSEVVEEIIARARDGRLRTHRRPGRQEPTESGSV